MKYYALGISCILLVLVGCSQTDTTQSVSGTKMATAGKVSLGPDGVTVEQRNIQHRIKMDNTPGSMKHLYVISAYSGQVLIYSTVDGKVTSSGKRLTPNRVDGIPPNNGNYTLPGFDVNGRTYLSNELLGEDGTVGSSMEFLYWWDAKGVYHQHYVQGGQIVHISDQPQNVKGVVINMDAKQSQ